MSRGLLMAKPVCAVSVFALWLVVYSWQAHGLSEPFSEADPEHFLSSFPQLEARSAGIHVLIPNAVVCEGENPIPHFWFVSVYPANVTFYVSVDNTNSRVKGFIVR